MNKDEAECRLYTCILILYKIQIPQNVKSWGILMILKSVLLIFQITFLHESMYMCQPPCYLLN
jgi:hypothetical protein